MTLQPLVQLDVERCFKVLRFRFQTDPSDKLSQASRGFFRREAVLAIIGSVVSGIRKSGILPPLSSLAPKKVRSGYSDNREWITVELIGFSRLLMRRTRTLSRQIRKLITATGGAPSRYLHR